MEVDEVVGLVCDSSNELRVLVPVCRLDEAVAHIETVLLSMAFGDPNPDGRGWVVFGGVNEKRCGH